MGKAFFFENEGLRLFGYLNNPEGEIKNCNGKARYGIVFCPPFGDEHIVSYRIIRNFAVKLCEKGIPVLRFDYRGYGDSEGKFEEATPETQVSDIRRAIEILRNMTGVESVGLMGLRLGGTLTLLVAQSEPDVQFIIMWSPILSPKVYFQGIIRKQTFAFIVNKEKRRPITELFSELNQGGRVDIGGYYLSAKAYHAFCGLDPIKLLQQIKQPVYIALEQETINMDKSVLEQLNNMHKDNFDVVTIDEDAFWKTAGRERFIPPPTRFIQGTIDWISIKNSHRVFSNNKKEK